MSGEIGRLTLWGCVAFALSTAINTPTWAWDSTERVSLGPMDIQANGATSGFYRLALSSKGRFVAFTSDATNLVAGDTNAATDVFIRDRQTHATTRVSVGANGVQAIGPNISQGQAISADGRFVAFASGASNLVPGDTNDNGDIFVRDRQKGTTTRVSLGPHGIEANSGSVVPSISADGRFVVFYSMATNLVPGPTNGLPNLFVRDRKNGTTERVIVGPRGVEGNSFSGFGIISADGRFVTYNSFSSNLVSGDTNGVTDVFVRDRQRGTTARVSVGANGAQANSVSFEPAISANGRFVVFASDATNLVRNDTNGSTDIFIRDRQRATTARVSLGANGAQANGPSNGAAVSADGRFVVFASDATNLVRNDTNGSTDIFIRDRQKGTTGRLSLGTQRAQANSSSSSPSISADGFVVGFTSDATNLVPNDTNDVTDAFVRFR